MVGWTATGVMWLAPDCFDRVLRHHGTPGQGPAITIAYALPFPMTFALQQSPDLMPSKERARGLLHTRQNVHHAAGLYEVVGCVDGRDLDRDGQTMRLYYHPLSSNSRRVLLTAHHLGLDLELVVVDLSTGEHKAPDYLRLNPNGRIPTLVDGEFELWESRAIMQYLADQSPGQDIYPRDVSARADVNRWLFWSAYHFAPAAALIIRERVSKKIVSGSGAPDPLEIARGEALFPQAARVLDRHLEGKQWIAQDRLTLADFAIAAPLMHMSAAQLPVTEFENLQAWFARVQSLDAWTKSDG